MPHCPRIPQPLLALALLPLLGGASCPSRPDPKQKEQAAIQYDLGFQALQNNDARTALDHYQKSLALDPDLDVAHNAIALLFHLSFGRLDDAIVHYRRAIELNPKFSEAFTNLANVYLAQGRYEEAIPLYEKALQDMLYKTPFIAEGNLGWCLYKKGEIKSGIDHIRSALVTNQKFCLGYRNLGIIYGETGEPAKSAESFALYAKHCPDAADARHRNGVALLKSGDRDGARRELVACLERAREQALGDECKKLLDLINRE